MSIIQEEASTFWSSTRDCTEYSYFEMGFDKAVDIIGCCFDCDYLNTDNCPIGKLIKEVDLHNYYCATFDTKDRWI